MHGRIDWRAEGWSALESGGEGWARGYAFLADGRSLEGLEIAEHLACCQDSLEPAVAALNGCFAAVLETERRSALVTDRYASIPIYLHRLRGQVAAAPDAWSVAGAMESSPALDVEAALDLLRTSYVTGTRTLLEGIETVAPACVLDVGDGDPRERRYWSYGYRPEPMSEADARNELGAVFARVAERTSRHLCDRGQRAALTLSGGLDSRVLAAILRKVHPEPLLALSYGTEGNPEVGVAAEVAEALELDFRTTGLSSAYWNSEFITRSVREVGPTTRFTCGLGARHLDATGADVVIPGHTGDFVSGGHLPAQVGMISNRRQLHAYLEFTHFRYLGSDRTLRRILNAPFDAMKWRSLEVSTGAFDFNEDLLGLVDRWNVENRQRRMILMELRAYERLGAWMLPFYDHELIDFYARVPHDQRVAQNLYIDTARHELFTGVAESCGRVRRVGRAMETDGDLYPRIERLRALQPLSGWFLSHGLARLRDTARTLRPKPDQEFGTDTVKAWFRDDPTLRSFILERVDALTLDLVDKHALAAVLRSDGIEERVYNRLLPGIVTMQESLDLGREAWQAGRDQRRAASARPA